MSVKSGTFYWVECDHDGCLARADEECLSETIEHALDVAIWNDIMTTGDKHYCIDHWPSCDVCGLIDGITSVDGATLCTAHAARGGEQE